jgi:glycosyltransferase domain-containing protein
MTPYTIVVPTFERPADLGRLLAFLRGRTEAAIVVLDSSGPDARVANGTTIARHAGVRHETYPPEIRFYDKLFDGVSRAARTPVTVLCADDDLVLPDAVQPAADLLAADPSSAVVHGYYAHFSVTSRLRVTALGYHGGEIVAADPLERVARGLLDYEATLYGAHRTDALVSVLDEARRAPSLFAAEITTAAVALAFGGMRRLPLFSHLRNDAPSKSARHWHPAELLAVDPAALVAGLAYVRDRVAALLPNEPPERLRLFDHAALAYVADYLRPDAARRFAEAALAGAADEELRALGWTEFAAMLQPTNWMSRLRRNRAVRLLKDGPLKQIPVGRLLARLTPAGRPLNVKAASASGAIRDVLLEPSFCRRLEGVGLSSAGPEVAGLVRALVDYHPPSQQAGPVH